MLGIKTWLAGNALKYGGLVAMCAVIWLHGCNFGAEGEKENTQRAEKKTTEVQGKFDTFVATTKAQGEKAEAEKVVKERADKALKEKTDADAKREITELRDRANRMLVARARGSYLPEAATTAGSPDDITFDRAELERALQRSDARVQALIVEGDEAKAKLASAVKWAAQWAAGEKGQGAGLTIPKPSKPSEPTVTD
jgi:hypothetical protein